MEQKSVKQLLKEQLTRLEEFSNKPKDAKDLAILTRAMISVIAVLSELED